MLFPLSESALGLDGLGGLRVGGLALGPVGLLLLGRNIIANKMALVSLQRLEFVVGRFVGGWKTNLLLLLLQGELLLLDHLQLVAEVELGRLLLQLGEFVLVLGHLLQRGLDAVF